MRRSVRGIIILLMAALMSACLPETRHTIVVEPLQIDPHLVGTWVRANDEMVMLLSISREEVDDRVARVAYVIVDPTADSIEVQRSILQVRLTRIGSATYFEAVPRGPDPFPYKGLAVGRFFGRLVLAGAATLELEFPDIDVLEAAIKRGEIEGRTERRDNTPVASLTSPTSELRAFLAKGVPAGDYSRFSFRKISSDPQ